MTSDALFFLAVGYAAAAIVGLLALYLVIRLAVTHSLRSHTRWVDAGGDAAPRVTPPVYRHGMGGELN